MGSFCRFGGRVRGRRSRASARTLSVPSRGVTFPSPSTLFWTERRALKRTTTAPWRTTTITILRTTSCRKPPQYVQNKIAALARAQDSAYGGSPPNTMLCHRRSSPSLPRPRRRRATRRTRRTTAPSRRSTRRRPSWSTSFCGMHVCL